MMLEAFGGGVEPDGQVALLVHGVQEPDVSITKQLTQILQKRLLLIAVDMLSILLTKNPHFHWKMSDLAFIDSFEKDWQALDENRNTDFGEQEVEYQFPPESFQDPGIILLFLRQNLCGSTFFHRLNESIEDDEESCEVDGEDIGLVDFNAHDFTFYYNNNPSKLDPNFQAVSTLTEKGEKFCREAGAGIAIIKFTLVHADGEPVQKLQFGVAVEEADGVIDVPIEKLRFRQVEENPADQTEEQIPPPPPSRNIRIRVSITATALKRQALHSWVLLTLNQSYAAWRLERQLEHMQRRMLRPIETSGIMQYRCQSSLERSLKVDKLLLGLPALMSIIENTVDLPHPAFAQVKETGVVRASSVATVAMDLLDIISMSVSETRKEAMALEEMTIVRLSRSEKPKLVKFESATAQRDKGLRVCELGRGTLMKDKPIDCPEYICFNCHPSYIEGTRDQSRNDPKMFKEVVVDDGNSDKSSSIVKLEKLKETLPSFFTRSFAFILSVKRNERTLFFINWKPDLVKK